MVVPFGVFGASKRVVWSLHSPRLEAPNVLDFAAPIMPSEEHPSYYSPFFIYIKRGMYRGGSSSFRQIGDHHGAQKFQTPLRPFLLRFLRSCGLVMPLWVSTPSSYPDPESVKLNQLQRDLHLAHCKVKVVLYSLQCLHDHFGDLTVKLLFCHFFLDNLIC